jgi:hypothetical protein
MRQSNQEDLIQQLLPIARAAGDAIDLLGFFETLMSRRWLVGVVGDVVV